MIEPNPTVTGIESSIDPQNHSGPASAEALIAFYVQTRETIRQNGTLQWEGIKFTTTLYTTLLAFHASTLGVYLAFAKKTITEQSSAPDANLVGVLLLAAPAAMLVFTTIGWIDLKRVTSRVLEHLGEMKSAESLLKLTSRVPVECRIFQEQDGLFPQRFALPAHIKTTSDFVKDKLWRRDTFFVLMTWQHGCMAFIALAVAIITVVLVF